MRTYLSHLECSACGEEFDAHHPHTVCPTCGKALLVRYDFASAKSALMPQIFALREKSMWRYRELLPVFERENIISLGEGMTPVVHLQRTGEALGLQHLYMKDESTNPTGSFKARGMSVAISKAKEFGIREVTVPSAGNAAGALSAYAARAGIRAHVFLPTYTPRTNISEVQMYGAEMVLINGTISDAAKTMAEANRNHQWFDCSTLKEPYRLEGKKTMGFEIAEQFQYELPDVIIYPTGGGTGLIGMWKAFAELEQLGWISDKRPRMVAVQSSGCAPIVRAFEQRQSVSTFWENAQTVASGLRVPKAFADYLILKVLYESGGTAIAVDDSEIVSDMKYLSRTEGIFACPEGAATLSALRLLLARGFAPKAHPPSVAVGFAKGVPLTDIKPSETVLLLNTGSGYKYTELFVPEKYNGSNFLR